MPCHALWKLLHSAIDISSHVLATVMILMPSLASLTPMFVPPKQPKQPRPWTLSPRVAQAKCWSEQSGNAWFASPPRLSIGIVRSKRSASSACLSCWPHTHPDHRPPSLGLCCSTLLLPHCNAMHALSACLRHWGRRLSLSLPRVFSDR